jgi:hypothetical protein
MEDRVVPRSAAPTCNHRALEVLVVVLGSLVVSLTTGVIMTALRAAPESSLSMSAAAFGGSFAVFMAIMKYVK